MNEMQAADYSRLTFFDVELANTSRASICSIGVVHMVGGKTVFEKSYLINPECDFSPICSNIHGLTRSHVKNAPTFPLVWEEIQGYFEDSVLVAHNAESMDLNALVQTLSRYTLPPPPFHFLCTLKLAREYLDDLPCGNHHALADCCHFLDIPLVHHHDALADAIACRDLFLNLEKHFGPFADEIGEYHPSCDDSSSAGLTSRNRITNAINQLYGFLYGIGCDCAIAQGEADGLLAWVSENEELRASVPAIDSCCHTIESILTNGYFSADAYAALIGQCQPSIPASLTKKTISLQIFFGILKGIAGDGIVTSEELQALKSWMFIHQDLKGEYPFDQVFDLISDVMADGQISPAEHQKLLDVFTGGGHSKENGNCEAEESKAPGLRSIEGKTFCLTGDFEFPDSKKGVTDFIVNHGGHVVGSISKKVSVLLVGSHGSTAWKFGTYGGKIQKAMDLRTKGAAIQIISENEFFTKEELSGGNSSPQ